MHHTSRLPASHLLPLALAGLLATASFGSAAQQPQLSAVDLARKNACMACHGLVHKQVGPGFAQIADRYRNDAAAPARLADKIRNGSVGAWGRVIMPRQSLVTEADAQVLARWVLAQQQPPAR
ncbi:c-type cytochrome [Variovorax sp. 38R]|uniref:c-type cytochrome n=1 Tax=Variovorax sp. 38R TaxID=2774875 RepID=UPI001785BCB1|nr:c-type cytochrome [Variovorax sp. 38R]QOF81235.1 c-type cytochrome [Variovorax sp. 38R]